MASLINALKIVKKEFSEVRIVINGAGAAGISIARLLKSFGAQNIILCDSKGAIYRGRTTGMNPEKELLAQETNKENFKGSLHDVIKNRDIFIGASDPGY